MRKVQHAACLLLLTAVMFSCREPGDAGRRAAPEPPKAVSGTGAVDTTVRTDTASIQKGKELFVQKCAFCHDAYSSEDRTGPGLYEILKRDRLPASTKPATPENIRMQLKNPYNIMPAFTDLPEEDVLNIIAFLNTL